MHKLSNASHELCKIFVSFQPTSHFEINSFPLDRCEMNMIGCKLESVPVLHLYLRWHQILQR